MESTNRGVARPFLLLGLLLAACACTRAERTSTEIPRDARGEPVVSEIDARR